MQCRGNDILGPTGLGTATLPRTARGGATPEVQSDKGASEYSIFCKGAGDLSQAKGMTPSDSNLHLLRCHMLLVPTSSAPQYTASSSSAE